MTEKRGTDTGGGGVGDDREGRGEEEGEGGRGCLTLYLSWIPLCWFRYK